MADTTNDGGPAFPTENAMQTGPSSCRYEGMTMRDYFAAKAMQGDLASQDEHEGHWMSDASTDDLMERARFYYRVADAMLKARDGQ